MNIETIDRFKEYFSCLTAGEEDQVKALYAGDIQFQDPIRKIKNLENVVSYLSKFNANLSEGGYEFTHQSILHDKAFLSWELELVFKVPAKRIKVSGITVLIITDKIISHRNYYDAGALFYENLPLIGPIVRIIKRQLYKHC
jgi:hypothetical protein